MKPISLIFICFLTIFLAGCTSSDISSEIEQLKNHPNVESDSIQRLLAEKYMEYAMENPSDSLSDDYLFNSSRAFFLLEDSASSIWASKTGLEYFPESELNQKRLATLAQLYTSRNTDSALYYYGLIPDSITLSRYEYKAIGDLYSKRYTVEPQAVDNLMKAGDYYFAAGMAADAAVMYKRFINEGEDDSDKVQALNVLGFLYQQMEQPDSAERYYQLLIDEYPETDEAKSASLILKTQSHRKSAEELLRSFKQK